MPPDPPVKRTVVFVDGQNLFHAAREAFGYTYPNYDIRALAERMCAGRGWQLTQARFYTGIPDPQDAPRWHHFWSAKLAVMGRQDVHVYSRSLRYRNRTVHLPDGTTHTFLAGEEKGIDVRRSEEHTSELQSRLHLVCRLLLEKKKNNTYNHSTA